MTFFTAEDFEAMAAWRPETLAQHCNAKLAREAKVVYGNAAGMIFNQELLPGDTHKALLLCIEPLEKPRCVDHIPTLYAELEKKLAECVDVISYLGANVLLLHAGNCPAAYSHENLFELCNCHVFKAAKFLAKVKK